MNSDKLDFSIVNMKATIKYILWCTKFLFKIRKLDKRNLLLLYDRYSSLEEFSGERDERISHNLQWIESQGRKTFLYTYLWFILASVILSLIYYHPKIQYCVNNFSQLRDCLSVVIIIKLITFFRKFITCTILIKSIF